MGSACAGDGGTEPYTAFHPGKLKLNDPEGEVRKCISVLTNRTGAHELVIGELDTGACASAGR